MGSARPVFHFLAESMIVADIPFERTGNIMLADHGLDVLSDFEIRERTGIIIQSRLERAIQIRPPVMQQFRRVFFLGGVVDCPGDQRQNVVPQVRIIRIDDRIAVFVEFCQQGDPAGCLIHRIPIRIFLIMGGR